MQFTIPQDVLASALGTTLHVVPAKSTLPVLSNVLLTAEAGSLTLAATNLEMAVTTQVKADVEKPGTITLPARLLGDYVSQLDKGTKASFELNAKTHRVHLACGHYEANISGIDSQDFPPIPSAEGQSVTLDAKTFRNAISAVVFAAAPDDTRPVLAGVLLSISGGALTLAAADGFRLATITIVMPDGGPELSVIIPSKSLTEVGRLLPDAEGTTVEVVVGQDNNSYAHFTFGPTTLSTRLITGSFPDYQRIIPQDPATTVTVARIDLLQATRVANVLARDNSNIVRMDIQDNKDDHAVLLVKSTSAEMGDTQGKVDCVSIGPSVAMAFNGRYLKDVLDALGSNQVEIGLAGPGSPGVFRPETAAHDITHVIMPMHVAQGV